jgi:preprotein translocase subunit SecA
MFNAFIKRVFGTKHERQMKRMQPLIDRINALEPKMKGLADADFPGLTADFRAQLAKGRPRARSACATTTCS